MFLLLLGEIDPNLQEVLGKFKNRPWELFLDYTSSPGVVIQNIRKLPDCLRKFLIRSSKNYLETIQKSNILLSKPFKNISEEGAIELAQLLKELLEFNRIVSSSATHEAKSNRLKRLEKNPATSTNTRATTPNLSKKNKCHIRKKTISHSNSFSKISLIGDKGANEKRILFLQESRFNRRVIEKLTEILAEKMGKDPDYLLEMKTKDFGRYQDFKDEFIEIHKNAWMQEAIKELEKSDLLRIHTEEDLKLIDAKKEAFFSYVCNEQLLKTISANAKTVSLRC